MCGVGTRMCGSGSATLQARQNLVQSASNTATASLTSTGSTDQARLGATLPSAHAAHGASGGTHIILERTAPNDVALATRIFQASLQLFDKLPFESTVASPPGKDKPFNPNSDHRRVPDHLKAEWKRLFPDLPVPSSIVYDLKTHKVQGAVFNGGKNPVDLGMGSQHQHQVGGSYMQHIWFTPGDLNLAFSDSTNKKVARAAASAR